MAAMEVDPKSRTTSPSTAMLSMSKSQNSPEPIILGNFVCLMTLSRDSSSYMENKKDIIVNEASQIFKYIKLLLAQPTGKTDQVIPINY